MVLQAKQLNKAYQKKPIVRDLRLQVPPGQVVGLLGPNGAGKTTTFHMILGVVRPDSGSIFLGSEDITRLPTYLRARKGIAYLPQKPSVFQKLTVEENIMAILETLDLSIGERQQRAAQLMAELGVKRLRDKRAYYLSGGERRRVEIARALVISPRFILLDEPFAGIDPITVADIQSMIFELKERGIGVLITDHNVRETLQIMDYSYIICNGSVLIAGTREELMRSAEARRTFLGENFRL